MSISRCLNKYCDAMKGVVLSTALFLCPLRGGIRLVLVFKSNLS